MMCSGGVLVVLIFCWSQSFAVEKPLVNDAEVDRADRFNTFDWALTKAIGAKAEENVILSPISVKLVLAMLYEGARGNTSKQLEKVLNIMPLARTLTSTKFSSILQSLEEANSNYNITIGTKVFIDQEAKPKQEFEKKIASLYNATIEKINFKRTAQAVAKINTWAKAVTKGHIQHLVSEADTRESTVMLLLNAVYFKGLWKNPFAVNSTVDDVFSIDAKTNIKVPFMKAVHTLRYSESPELKASILRMPYMGEKFAMYILLPFEKTGIQDVIAAISPEKLRAVIDTMMDVTVQISLPKFHFEFASSLAPVLQQLGITDMFNNNANLSEIAEGPKELVVSNVIQKAGINVNEQGSTAYATTVVDLTSKFGEHTVQFKVAHPFLFFIEDETTDTVVFVGKVVNPTGIGKPKVQAAPPKVDLKEGEENFLLNPQTFAYFDIELVQILNSLERSSWVISPSSIKSVIALILEGAEGSTLHQLSHILRLPFNKTIAQKQLRAFSDGLQKDSKHGVMKSVSRVLVRKDIGVKPKYKKITSSKYNVDVESEDFSAPTVVANQINAWVNDLTEGMIPQLLNPGSLNSNTSLLFLNAIYFKGDWNQQFDPALTHVSCFFTRPNECKRMELMSTTGYFKYGYIHSLDAKILELPYSDPRYSMVILLPTKTYGYHQAVRNLPFNNVFPILDNLPFVELTVFLPKFTVEYSVDLVPLLQRLGATELFTEKANLEEMLPPSVKAGISSVVHKAKLTVNEKGTLAAAATAAIAETLMSRQAEIFRADHPFLFFIKDSFTGCFLFEGIFSSPTPSSQQVEQLNSVSPLRLEQVENGKPSTAQNIPYPRPPLRNKIQINRAK